MMPPMLRMKNQKNCVRLQLRDVAEKGQGRQHVENSPLNGTPEANASSMKRGSSSSTVAAQQLFGVKGCRWSGCRVSGSGRQLISHKWRRFRHEPENGVPVEIPDDQPARNRSNREHPKKDGDLAHNPLRLGQGENTSRTTARETTMPARWKDPARHGKNQLPDILRQGASGGGGDKDGQPRQNHRPAAKLSDSAMEQIHEGEAEQMSRQGLLHLDGRGLQRIANGGKCRNGNQVSMEKSTAWPVTHGQQDGQGPQGRFPETLGDRRVHQKEKVFGCERVGKRPIICAQARVGDPVFSAGIVRAIWQMIAWMAPTILSGVNGLPFNSCIFLRNKVLLWA